MSEKDNLNDEEEIAMHFAITVIRRLSLKRPTLRYSKDLNDSSKDTKEVSEIECIPLGCIKHVAQNCTGYFKVE